MEPISRKQTLPELVIERLREAIDRGEWTDKLPSERVLSDRLHVSRSTIRLAIEQLKREGLLGVAKRRTVIRQQSSRLPTENLSKRQIVFLSPVGLEELTWTGLVLYAELGKRLTELDASIRIVSSGALARRRVDSFLDRLIEESGADGWVLYRASYALQEYIQRSGMPAVLFGNAHEGIDLPALTICYAAALRHSLAQFFRLGHEPQRILLVIPETHLAGNLEVEAAFVESLESQATTQVLRHYEDDSNLPVLLRRGISRSPRITAIVVLRTSAAATIHGLLASDHKLSMPSDISMLCLEDAPFMRHLVPEISRYHIKSSRVTQFVFSSLGRQLASGSAKGWVQRPLVPEFIKGKTVGRAPTIG